MELDTVIDTIEKVLGDKSKDEKDVQLFQWLTVIRSFLLELKERRKNDIPIDKQCTDTPEQTP